MIDQSKNYHFLSTYWPSWRSLFLGQFLQAQTQLQAMVHPKPCVQTSSCTAEDRDAPNLGKAVHVCPQVCGGYKQQI